MLKGGRVTIVRVQPEHVPALRTLFSIPEVADRCMRQYELGNDGEWHDGLLMDLLRDELA